MMTLFGRIVLRTTLDPLPAAFRMVPGVIAINERELKALSDGDGGTFKWFAAMCHAQDSFDFEKQERRSRRRRRR